MSLPDNTYEFCLLLNKYKRKRISKSEFKTLQVNFETNEGLKKLFAKETGELAPTTPQKQFYLTFWVPTILVLAFAVWVFGFKQHSSNPVQHSRESNSTEATAFETQTTEEPTFINTQIEVKPLTQPNVEIIGLEAEIQLKINEMLIDPSSELSNFELPEINSLPESQK